MCRRCITRRRPGNSESIECGDCRCDRGRCAYENAIGDCEACGHVLRE